MHLIIVHFVSSQMDTIDESQIEQLERIVGMWFDLYPRLWPRQRFGYNRALSRLLGALYSKGSALRSFLSKIGKYISRCIILVSI